MAYVPNSGSVVAFQSDPANLHASVTGTVSIRNLPSVSGTVGASIIGTAPVTQAGTWTASVYGNVSVLGTVPVTQVTNPWVITGSVQTTALANQSVSGTVGASIIGLTPVQIPGSVAVAIVSGSIAASFTPPANQSVSGTVDVTQITSPWIITGSVQGSFSPSGNQSVSGTVGASIIGLPPVNVTNTNLNVSGSVAAWLQSTNASVITVGGGAGTQYAENTIVPSVTGTAVMFRSDHSSSIMSVVDPVTPLPIVGSVSGSVGIVGTVNVSGSVVAFVSGLQGHSVSGTVLVGNFPTTQNVSGSVVASGTVGASLIGLGPVSLSDGSEVLDFYQENQVDASVVGIATMFKSNVSTSIMSVVSPTNPFPITGTVGASIIGLTPVNVTNTTINVSGSVAASGTVGASIIGLPPINGNVAAGTVDSGNPVKVGGKFNASALTLLDLQRGDLQLDASGNTKVAVNALQGHSVSGTVQVGNFPTNQNVSGSVVAFGFPTNQNISGSVVAFVSGTVPVNAAGSVVAFQGTSPWVIQSIVGTYAEDVASTAADKGIFTLGIRNDAVASLVGADLDYTGYATDSAGRHLIKPFAADENRLDTQTSVVSGSVTALFSSVTGLRQYVTDVMVANTGSVATLVTFKDGSTSILGYTIAPAGGGSNIIGMNFPFRTAPAQDFVFSVSPSTSILYISAKGYKAP